MPYGLYMRYLGKLCLSIVIPRLLSFGLEWTLEELLSPLRKKG